MMGSCISSLQPLWLRALSAVQKAPLAGATVAFALSASAPAVAGDGAVTDKPVEIVAPDPGDERRLVGYMASSRDDAPPLFERTGNRLEEIRATGQVRRVFLASLPSGFSEISVPAKRKAAFISLVLPLILHVNETIAAVREQLISLRDREVAGAVLSDDERLWLASVAEWYGFERVDYGKLLKSVDIILPSLAIAQAAEESGWGTSRFARAGNALFGQRTYKPGAHDMVPQKRENNSIFRVRSYNNLLNSVFSYAHNLNSHEAYSAFRDARARMRQAGRMDGNALVGTLSRYSERGEAYIETIRRIMRTNDLSLFDRARFVDGDDQT